MEKKFNTKEFIIIHNFKSVIFLDVDGVLNCQTFYDERYKHLTRYDNIPFYKTVKKHLKKEQHTTAWSVFQTAQSLGYMIGPVLAVYLLNLNYELPLYATIVFVLISLGVSLVLHAKQRKQTKNIILKATEIIKEKIPVKKRFSPVTDVFGELNNASDCPDRFNAPVVDT